MPRAVILAGPNGAGKTTAAERLVRGQYRIRRYVDFDALAAGLARWDVPFATPHAQAYRETWLNELVSRESDFAMETTFTSRRWPRRIATWAAAGYEVDLIYLWIRDPALCARRVEAREREDGRRLRPPEIRRTWRDGTAQAGRTLAQVTNWLLLENSGDPTLMIATGTGDGRLSTIEHQGLWDEFWSVATGSRP